MTDSDVIDLLAQLGEELDRELADSTGDLATRVVEAVEHGDSSSARPRVSRSPWLLTAAAAALLVVALVAAVPGARRTVARWFGVGSVRIETVTTTPAADDITGGRSTTATSGDAAVPDPLDLGPPVDADDAVASTGLPLPVAPALGEPASWHLPGGPQIVARHEVAGRTILVAALAGGGGDALFAKEVGEDAVVYVDLDGAQAVWIEGEPHWFGYVGADGSFAQEPLRLASDTLLWDRDGVTYRVEGASDLTQAMEIARSMEL